METTQPHHRPQPNPSSPAMPAPHPLGAGIRIE
jgi:hypothetical protein